MSVVWELGISDMKTLNSESSNILLTRMKRVFIIKSN